MKISVILWNPSHSDGIRILQIAHRSAHFYLIYVVSYCLHCDTANLLCLERHTSTRATQINRTKSYQLRSNFCSHTLMRWRAPQGWKHSTVPRVLILTVWNLSYSVRNPITRGATGHTNLEEVVVEGGEHGREGGPHTAPPGGPVQALRRGGPQLVAGALQRPRPRPVRALGRGGRDQGGAPPQRARRRRDPVRDRRHVRRQRAGGRESLACSAARLGLSIGAVAVARAHVRGRSA